MNKSYKSVWNEALHAWVAVAEHAKARGKKSRSGGVSKLAPLALAAAAALGSGGAYAQSILVTSTNSDGLCVAIPDAIGPTLAVVPSSLCTVNSAALASASVGSGSPALFYNNGSGVQNGPTNSLALGGELIVTSGKYGTGPNGTGLRLGGVATLNAAVGSGGIAIGNASTGTATQATGSNSVAIGSGANASNTQAIAIGDSASAAANSIGGFASNTGGIAIGYKANAANIGSGSSIAIGITALASSSTGAGDSAAIGTGAQATGQDSTAIGGQAVASGTNTLALGVNGTKATGSGATALGARAQATGANSTAIGSSAIASAASTIAQGNTAQATAANAIAIGTNAIASSANAVALGSTSTTAAANPTTSATITSANGGTITYGGFQGTNPTSVVSVGSAGSERQITNVAAGRITSTSTDAINGSQLYATNAVLGNVAKSVVNNLGGTTVLNVDGTITGATYNVAGNKYTTVYDAIQAAGKGWNLQTNGGTLANVAPGDTLQLNNGTNIAISRVGTNVTISTTPNLTADSLTINGGPVINGGGITLQAGDTLNMGGNAITNVGPGVAGTDAVNLDQLNAARTHYYSVNSTATAAGSNYNNDGATGTNALAAGPSARAAGNSAVSIGDGAGAGGGSGLANEHNVAIGASAGINVQGKDNTAVGYKAGATVTGYENTAVGRLAGQTVTGNQNAALGEGAGSVVTGSDNSAFGYRAGAAVTGSYNVAMGINAGSGVQADYTTSVGAYANAEAANSVALGMFSNATAANGVALGANSVADRQPGTATATSGYDPLTGTSSTQTSSVWRSTLGAVSVGNDLDTRQITGVAAGSADTDAVNVAQLKQVNSLASAGWNLQANGDAATNVAPGGKVQLLNGTNIAITRSGTDVTIGTTPNLAADSLTINGGPVINNGGITMGAGDTLNMGGNAISNVAPGVAGTDAVNMSQLNAVTTHYYSVNDGGTEGGNYDNKGATGVNSLAAGVDAKAVGPNAIAMGYGAQTVGGISIGSQAGNQATAPGIFIGASAGSLSGGTDNLFIGDFSGTSAGGSQNIVMGAAAGQRMNGDSNVVVGNQAGQLLSGSFNAYAGLRSGTQTNGDYNTGMGGQAGMFVTGRFNAALGYNSGMSTKGDYNTALGADAGLSVEGEGNVSIGRNANMLTKASRTVAIGNEAKAGDDEAVAIGAGAQALGASSISIGAGNLVAGARSGAIGDPSIINGADSYSVGNNNTIGATTTDAFVLGNNVHLGADASGATTTSVTGAVALGSNTGVTQPGGVALGSGSQATVGAGVAGYDVVTGAASTNTSSTWKATKAAVSVGDGTASTRQITSVAAGFNDTDAVNVAQLKQVNSLASAGWNVNTGTVAGSTGKAAGSAVTNVAPGGQVDVLAGNNIEVTQVGSQLQIATSLTPSFDTVAVGGASGTVINGSGITTGGGTGPSLTTGGINAGGMVIGNVAPGVADTDAVNMSQLNTLADTPLTFTGDTGTTDRKLGETLNIAGDGKNVSTEVTDGKVTVRMSDTPSFTSLSTTGDVSVGGALTVTGPSTLNGGATINNSLTLGTGTVVNMGDNQIHGVAPGTGGTDAVNLDQLNAVSGVAGKGWNVTTAATGTGTATGTAVANVAPGDTATFTAGNNIAVTQNGQEVQIATSLTPSFDTVAVGGASGTVINGSGITTGGGAGPSLTTGGINAGGMVVSNVAPGVASTDAVNMSQLNGLADTPLTFTGDTGTTDRKLGETFNIAGDGKNVFTEVTDGKVTVHMSDTPSFTSVTATDAVTVGGTVINNNGITTGGGTGPSLTTGGINAGGTVISGVAPGAAGTDAVNVDQLDAVSSVAGKGWNVTTAATGTGTATGTAVTNVAPGDTATFTAGNNIAITQNGKEVQIATSLTPSFDTVTVGGASGTVINGSGITTGGGTGPSLTTGGINAGGMVIGNVAPGVADTDAVNVHQLTGLGNSTASSLGGSSSYNPTTNTVTAGLTVGGNTYNNVQDALSQVNSTASAGWNLQANGDPATNVAPGATVQLLNGTNILITRSGNNVTISTDPNLVADSLTINGGPTINNGGITMGAGNVLNMGGNAITNVAAGVNATDAVNLSQLTQATNAAANKWITGSQTTSYTAPVATGAESTAVGSGAVASGSNSVAVGTGATASTANSVALGNGSTTTAAVGTSGTTIQGNSYSFAGANPSGVVSVGSAGAERQIQNVAAGQLSASSTDAVNGSQLYATNQAIEAIGATASAGINVTTAATGTGIAIGTSVANVGPGGTATYTAGNNTVLTQNGTNITFAVADNPNFSSVTVGGTSITSNGVSIQGGPSMTTSGINAGGQAITNVAPGVNGTDAVNVNQLSAGLGTVSQNVNALRTELAATRKDANAGTAGAMAMAGMPQAYLPGKSMFAAGAATYEGQTAIAIGLSKISDNGKWVTKITGSANSRGNVGLAVGAGYQW